MRVAIVSDIHGNRHAFEAVLDAIEASDCQEMWCLGDLVGYGAEPDACVELARRYAAICLAGNHDLGVRGALPLEEFSRGAALAARWTQGVITPETREYLDKLEPAHLDRRPGQADRELGSREACTALNLRVAEKTVKIYLRRLDWPLSRRKQTHAPLRGGEREQHRFDESVARGVPHPQDCSRARPWGHHVNESRNRF